MFKAIELKLNEKNYEKRPNLCFFKSDLIKVVLWNEKHTIFKAGQKLIRLMTLNFTMLFRMATECIV